MIEIILFDDVSINFFLVQTLGALQSPAKGDLGLMDVSA